MTRQGNAGFTIIEVMLFLAVSGLMMVGLMVGTSAAIQSQQYRDAVQSYANFLRDQYSKVITVVNNRPGDASCTLTGGAEAGSAVARGTSECVIVGRYVSADAPGDEYEARPIYALQRSDDSWSYALGEVDETYLTSWAVETSIAGTAAPSAAVVMWRDPVQGMLRIAVSRTESSGTIGAFIAANSAMSTGGERELCVRRTGLAAAQAQSVFIDAVAGSGDAIRVASATEGCTS